MHHASRASTRVGRVAFLALLSVAPISFAAAQQPSGASSTAFTPAELAQPLPIDSDAIIGTLPNGLRYYIRKTTVPAHRAALRLVVRAGSLQEDEDQRGLAHLVEHMQFNGSPHFPNKGDLVAYLESIGLDFGADLNAETNFDNTTYMLTVPTSNTAEFARGFDVLQDWAGHATFTAANVEAERKVVFEEWRRGLGVSDRVRKQTTPILMPGSRYAVRTPIGDTTTIKSATLEQLQRYYRDWYRPDLMAVIACGDFDPAQVEQWIKERFAPLTNPTPERPLVTYHVPDNTTPIVSIVADTELTDINVTAMFKLPFDTTKRQTVGDYRRDVVNNIFSTALEKRLSDLRFVNNPPFNSASASFDAGLGDRTTFRVSVTPPSTGITDGLAAALAEVERIARFGITEPELKKYEEYMAHGLNGHGTTDIPAGSYALSYTSAFLKGLVPLNTAKTLEVMTRLLPTITSADVMQAAAVVRQSQNLLVSVTLPKSGNIFVPDTASLLAVFDDVKHIRLAQYVDRVDAIKFMNQPPSTSGRIVSTRQVGGGVTEWMLSNGVRVLVRPSKNDPGTVAISGSGPTGYATFIHPGESPVPALHMGELIAGGGFGNFQMTDINQVLNDHHMKAAFRVGEQETQLGGSGLVENLETLFQLIYLQATQPKLDDAWVQYYKKQIEYAASQKKNSIQAHLQDTMQLTMTSNHPLVRAALISSTTADALDPPKAFADVKADFKDMSQWDFLIVGDVRLDSLAPLVARYLGALPGHPSGPHIDVSKRVPVDLGIHQPSGVVQTTLQADLVPRTTTLFVFHGPAQYTRKSDYEIYAVQELVKKRLLDKLRMQMNGTYDVDVTGEITRTETAAPTYTSKMTISYSCDPNRADEMAAAMFAVIDSLKTTPPSDAEVAVLRRQTLNKLEQNVNDVNLMHSLQVYNTAGWSFDLIGKDADLVNAWTGADLSAAARQYLNDKEYARFNVVPKPIELEE